MLMNEFRKGFVYISLTRRSVKYTGESINTTKKKGYT